MGNLLLKDEVYAVMGAAIEVHRELGAGFLEAVYQEAMELELQRAGVPFKAQQPVRIRYKGCYLRKEYIADLICFGQIVAELKALERITGKEESQLLNYLRVTGFRVGLLLNFGSYGKLDWKRMVK
jgi:GxxExxY protein